MSIVCGNVPNEIFNSGSEAATIVNVESPDIEKVPNEEVACTPLA